MKNTALALAVVTLSICFGLQLQKADSASITSAKDTTMDTAARRSSAVDERGSVIADTNDSDEFFQLAVKPGLERDHSDKIEALIKRMTLEEKLGQLQQLDGDADGHFKAEQPELVRKGLLGSTLNVRGKEKKTQRGLSRKNNWKKAYVRLAPGQTIDLTASE